MLSLSVVSWRFLVSLVFCPISGSGMSWLWWVGLGSLHLTWGWCNKVLIWNCCCNPTYPQPVLFLSVVSWRFSVSLVFVARVFYGWWGGRCSASLAGLVRTKAGGKTGKSRPFYTLPGWHIFPGLGCSVVANFLFTIFTCFPCGSLFIRVWICIFLGICKMLDFVSICSRWWYLEIGCG